MTNESPETPVPTESGRLCPRCGKTIPPGRAECPTCAPEWFRRPVSRETVLLLSLPAILILFVIVGIASSRFHTKQRELAEEWFRKGEESLAAGAGPRAAEEFRTALVYAHDSPRQSLYRRRLAQALLAMNRADEARAYLLNLWEREPGSGTLNLELARLAVQRGDVAEAVRYFNGAIFGVWEAEPDRRRREARLEFCRFLLDRGLREEAEAALIELAANLPRETRTLVQVGALFLQNHSYQRALDLFRQALSVEPKDPEGLELAGEAAFHLGEYREARRFWQLALRADPENLRVAEMLETASLILTSDPFARGISTSESARRALRALRQSSARLQACAEQLGESLDEPQPPSGLKALAERLQALEPRPREIQLARDTELRTAVAELAFDIQEVTARACGSPTGRDLALLLIAEKRGGAEP
jgi:tetratricopeptide (TPR) repeat protein